MPPTKTSLLDADILIQYLRGNPDAAAAIQRLNGAYGLSVIAYLEVAVPELARDARRSQTVNQALASLKLYSLTGTAAKQAARVQAQLIRNNQRMGFQDLCIAAIAVENKATLITRNQAHLALYPGLKLQRW